MQNTLILYPIFPMLALTVYVLFRTFFMRLAAVKSGEISYKYYRLYNEGEEPAACLKNSRHLNNLLEIPPLFYISCILIYITGINSLTLVICAWLFVLTRFIHSYVHLGANNVRNRYRSYAASICVLIVIWVVTLISILTL